MATFRERENGNWQAIVRRKGKPNESKTFEKKADAEKWARSVEVAMDRGSFVSTTIADNKTFNDLADDFEKKYAPLHYRGEGWKYKLRALRKRLGAYALAGITTEVVNDYRDGRLKDVDPRYTKTPKNAPKISGSTVKTEIDLLSKMFDVASKNFSIQLPMGNPARQIQKPPDGKARDRRLTNEEWDRLSTECKSSKNPWLANALILAVETGMRQGELLGLKRSDIDDKRNLALLLDVDKIKTKKRRGIPLSSKALAAIADLPATDDSRLVPLARMALYKAFGNACRRAGIENYTWHDLRHEACSRLAELGTLSLFEIALISGHKNLQSLDRYTHLQAENLVKKLG